MKVQLLPLDFGKIYWLGWKWTNLSGFLFPRDGEALIYQFQGRARARGVRLSLPRKKVEFGNPGFIRP